MFTKNMARRGQWFAVFGAVILCGMTTTASALAENLKPLVDRLERLERDIRTLNIQISRAPNASLATQQLSAQLNAGLPSAGIARLTMRLDNLEQDIRTTTGSLEQLGNNIRQLKDRLDRLVSDIDFRLSSYDEKLSGGRTTSLKSSILSTGDVLPSSSSAVDLEAIAANGGPVNATGQVAPDSEKAEKVLGTVTAKEVSAIRERTGSSPVNSTSINSDKLLEQKPLQVLLPAGKPKEQYTFALNLLRQTKYGQAKVALTQFIALRPKHPLAGNARYWLGETFYVQADYEQAAQTFFKSYRESPTNPKAPDMLLKLGMSLSQLKKPKEACATFEKLTKDFPSASTRIISAVARERKRARC